ncbi:MAG TPA: PQQ-dependent sugar dehydrogenase, partial [Planctomycetota bacterium]|nr:PQQ-dependent sugar dehydrogenase [Planctomycetota bacterium]
MRFRTMCLVGLALAGSATAAPLHRMPLLAAVPTGFFDTRVVNGLAAPTAFEFAPGGRIFVTEKGGSGGVQTANLRVIKNGVLLPTPFMSLSVITDGERGLLGVAADPNYATNRAIYVYYCHSDAQHNYLSKFVADATLDVRDPS